jgi:hypothetical protein
MRVALALRLLEKESLVLEVGLPSQLLLLVISFRTLTCVFHPMLVLRATQNLWSAESALF